MLNISFNNTSHAKRRFSYSSPPAAENPILVLASTINCILFKPPEAEDLKWNAVYEKKKLKHSVQNMYIILHRYSLQSHRYEWSSIVQELNQQYRNHKKWNVVLITRIFKSTSLHNLINYHLIFHTRVKTASPYADEANGNHCLIPVRESDMHPDQPWCPTNLLLSWHHGCFPLGQSVWSVKLAINPHPVGTVTHRQQYLSLHTHYTENCWNVTYKSFRVGMSSNRLLCKRHFR